MCGRFVQAQTPDVYARFFGAEPVVTEALAPSYNVAPTDAVYAVAEHDGERQLGTFRWGLLPFWAKDRKMAARNINARVETAADKPAFRDSFASRRCLIPADGFYEWERKEKGGKLPHYVHAEGAAPLAFAGLWARWRDPETEERLTTCTILTGEPSELVEPIHDRMPVVLPPDTWDEWLDRDNTDVDRLRALLAARSEVPLAEHAVSTLVNKVANNVPECIVPLETPAVER
jgi:putative SOS response-associated peptidase YedK